MAFENFSQFLQMGTHGAYVWSAYGITVLSLMGAHAAVRLRYRRLQRELQQLKNTDVR